MRKVRGDLEQGIEGRTILVWSYYGNYLSRCFIIIVIQYLAINHYYYYFINLKLFRMYP